MSDTALWHPFSNMATVRDAELTITRGDDVWLWDAAGRRYLDASASLWYANVGHGRREIADAAHAQMTVLEDFNAFGDIANEPALELARRLADLAPMPDAKVFFTTGGGEAVDTAAKLARRYWSVLGLPQRVHVIGRMAGYHGTNGFGTSIGGIEANRAGFGPLVPHTSYVPFDSFEALEAEILRIGSENVAAFFMEPVMGAGGVNLPPENYVEGVADVCERHGVLLICDSVICGFGRLGSWYGIERWGVEPDMITFAKGVTSGYLPLGGVVTSSRVAEPFWTGDGALFRHGATYSAHPTCCAAGIANIDILEREGLIARGAELEGALDAVLRPLADHPLVTEVRAGIGLMGAVEIDPPGLAAKVAVAARERGVMPRALVSSVAVSPPLTIQQPELELIGSTLRDALDAVLEQAAPHDGAASSAARSTTAR
jgi:adenosylmethionine-8-amino-7-oxononanoate aminotransferase